MHKQKQTGRHTDNQKHTGKHTDNQIPNTDTHTDRHTDETDIQTQRQQSIDKSQETKNGPLGIEEGTHGETLTDNPANKKPQIQTDRGKHRQTYNQTDWQTDRQPHATIHTDRLTTDSNNRSR